MAATQVKDAVEVIRLVQSIIPNYDERRREGADGYFEGTRLQELDMIRSWLNGAIECFIYFLWDTVLFATLFSCNSDLFWFVLAPIKKSDFPSFAHIFLPFFASFIFAYLTAQSLTLRRLTLSSVRTTLEFQLTVFGYKQVSSLASTSGDNKFFKREM